MVLVVSTVAVLAIGAAWSFRSALRGAERPIFFVDAPAWPRALAPVASAVDRWREEGRISQSEHDRLMALVREDAQSRP